jgi:hypothetical protein
MKPKKCLTKQEQINYWIEHYLQAKVSGDKAKTRMFESLIIKLGGRVPKI